jgi:hypothetical protein
VYLETTRLGPDETRDGPFTKGVGMWTTARAQWGKHGVGEVNTTNEGHHGHYPRSDADVVAVLEGGTAGGTLTMG